MRFTRKDHTPIGKAHSHHLENACVEQDGHLEDEVGDGEDGLVAVAEQAHASEVLWKLLILFL